MALNAPPIEDDEILIRRVPKQVMAHAVDPIGLGEDTFAPHREHDHDGISLFRARYHTPEQITQDFRPSGNEATWLAFIKYSDLKKTSAIVDVTPQEKSDKVPEQVGHISISNMNTNNRKSQTVIELKKQLLSLVFQYSGPHARQGTQSAKIYKMNPHLT